ncbi:uncharacterized protein LOC144179853 [Haemaphysalis longicornis]
MPELTLTWLMCLLRITPVKWRDVLRLVCVLQLRGKATAAGSSPFPTSLGGGHRGQQGFPVGHQLLRCQQCSFTAPRPSLLEIHQRIHTGERPHQCSHCGKAFVQKGHLVAHLRIHTGERPFRCHLCPRAFAQQATLDGHLRIHTGERPFRCHFCPEAFTYRLQRKAHEEKEHRNLECVFLDAYEFSCFCSRRCMHRPFVYFGNALVTAAIAVVCKCLPKVSVSSENLFVHVFFILDVWSCFASRLTTSIAKGPSSSPNGHMVQEDPPSGYGLLRCQQCSYVTPSSNKLMRHRRTHTGERPHQCSHCGKAFVQKAHLVTHLRIHTGERPHQCHLCPSAFTQKAHLVSHVRSHTTGRSIHCSSFPFSGGHRVEHGPQPSRRLLRCQQCSFVTFLLSNLERHQRTHTGERPYQCSHCGKAFMRKDHLDAVPGHIRPLQKGLPDTNGDANSSFVLALSSSALLLMHCHYVHRCMGSQYSRSLTLAGPSPNGHVVQHVPPLCCQLLRCQQCSYGTLSPSKLKRHWRTHTGERPPSVQLLRQGLQAEGTPVPQGFHPEDRPGHPCPSPSSRGGHRVQHSQRPGRRLFCCQQCSFTASRPSLLKVHQRIHTGERPYQCSHCGNAFVQKGHLDTHLRIHTGERRPFCCHLCRGTFATKNTLVRHLRTHTDKRPFRVSSNAVHIRLMTRLKNSCCRRRARSFHLHRESSFRRCSTSPFVSVVRFAAPAPRRSIHLWCPEGCRASSWLCLHSLPRGCRSRAEADENSAGFADSAGWRPEPTLHCCELVQEVQGESNGPQISNSFILKASWVAKYALVYTRLCKRNCRYRAAGPSSSPNGHMVQEGPPTGRGLLRCQQCSYVTPSSSKLMRHRRTHTGERPHQCSHCGKAFVQKNNLVTHLRIHTGERPYQCHLCPRAFTQKITLVGHVRTHTGERPFRCLFCPMTFTYRLQQKVHEEEEHSHRL